MRSLVNRLKKRFSGSLQHLDALAVLIPLVALVMLFALGVSFVNESVEQELLAETPLAETHYWYSLDNFPKYKLEAAKMVQEQMESGLSKEEACNNAINATSDKIYQDYLDFANANTDTDLSVEEWETELAKYLLSKQK